MTLAELIANIGSRLGQAGIPYMIVGSIASSYHGEARATRDLDVVIDPSVEALRQFVAALPNDEFYADVDAALEALRERSQFNVIDQASGWKVDLVIRKDRPFSVEEFGRRQPAELVGIPSFVATAEDMIIGKLEWAKRGESERQLRDVAAMVAIGGEGLDIPYIERWVIALGLEDGWRQTRGEAG
ncbi:MAG: hypothetical protein ABIZ71_05525 [Gemmatimonadales bacterium]